MRELRDRRDGGRVIATRRHFWRLLGRASRLVRFLAIFDGLFFAWQWWEIALFKGKNRFAVGGVSGPGPCGELSRRKLVCELDEG